MHFDPTIAEDAALIARACAADLPRLCGKRLLITGATGFIGSYLVDTLSAWNLRQPTPCQLLLPVRSPARAATRLPHLQRVASVRWFHWPEGITLVQAVPGDADFVIHAAAPADPSAYLQDPIATMLNMVDLTRQVVEYADREPGCERILYLSSGAVYGSQPRDLEAIPETYAGAPDPRARRSCYGEAKRFSELLCQLAKTESVVARLFAFLGPYQSLDGSFAIPDFLSQAWRDRRIRLSSSGRSVRTFCYAADLAASLWKLLLCAPAGECYNVGAAGPVLSIREVAEIIARQMGGMPVESAAPPTEPPASRYIPDLSKLQHFYRPALDFDSGIARTIAWHRQHSWMNQHRHASAIESV